MDRKAGARGAGVTQFLGEYGIVLVVRAGAAEFLGRVGAQEARGAGFQPDFAADHAGLFPRAVVRGDFGFDEAPHGVAIHLVFVAIDRAGNRLHITLQVRCER